LCGFSKARWAVFCAVHGAGSFHTLARRWDETHPVSGSETMAVTKLNNISEASNGMQIKTGSLRPVLELPVGRLGRGVSR